VQFSNLESYFIEPITTHRPDHREVKKLPLNCDRENSRL
jgi:hypothetical protein